MERKITKQWTVSHSKNSPSHVQGWVLEPGRWEEFDPFLIMAEDWFQKGTFGLHPHRGMETVTYVVDGELEHQDNHGGEGILKKGDVQWMTAGKGILHKEEPVGDGIVHSLQLWVNLPAKDKMTDTRYQDLHQQNMPFVKEKGISIRVFSGKYKGIQAPTLNYTPITMLDIMMEPEAETTIDIPASYNGFLYILEGNGIFGENRKEGEKNNVLWFGPGIGNKDENSTLSIKTNSDVLHAVLYAGEPIREKVVARGPFVMNTEEEIQQAFLDYRQGKF